MKVSEVLSKYTHWIDVKREHQYVSRHIYDHIEVTPLLVTLFSGENSIETKNSLTFNNCEIEFSIEPYRRDVEKLLIKFKNGDIQELYCINIAS